MASTIRYPLLSRRKWERDGDMHAESRLFVPIDAWRLKCVETADLLHAYLHPSHTRLNLLIIGYYLVETFNLTIRFE